MTLKNTLRTSETSKKIPERFPSANIRPSPFLPPLSRVLVASNLDERKTMQFGNMVMGTRRVARHTSLYRQHDKMRMLYVIRSGQFKLVSGSLNDERVAGFNMVGDLIGLDAIASGEYNFRMVALEDSEVYEIPFAAIANAINAEQEICSQFLKIMSEALNNEYSQSSLLAKTSLDARFASFLLALGEKYARHGYSNRSFTLKMSRCDIGSYLGTTNESISRLIARFNAHGTVVIKGRAVELLDRPFLKALESGACMGSQVIGH